MFDLKYNQGLPSYSNYGFAMGNTGHGFQEQVISYKSINRVLPEWDKVNHLPGEIFEAMVKSRKIKLKKKELEKGLQHTHEKYKEMAFRGCEAYYYEIAPNINAVGIEETIFIKLEGLKYKLQAKLDIREAKSIRDLKFKTKNEKPKPSLQFTIYSIAHYVKYGFYPQFIQDTVVILVKSVNAYSEEVKITDSHVKRAINIVSRFEDCYEKGVYLPAAEAGWWCTHDCDYIDYCEHYI